MSEIFILGGGASGMAAALGAAAHGPVTLLERQARLGRKLLATGNGRCNLSNTAAGQAHYHGADPAFVRPALAAYPPAAVLRFFHELGLRTAEEYGGRVYPRSDHAASVLDVLRIALEQRGVTVRTGCPVRGLRRSGDGFVIDCETGRFSAKKLIVACGGCAGGKLGGVTDGYTLLEGLGHRRTKLYPALVALRCASDYPKALKGVRVVARASVLRGETPLGAETGDVLFTDTGVSGTAIFSLSRSVSAGGAGLSVSLDLFPEETEQTLLGDLRRRREAFASRPANELLVGAVQNRLGLMLCKAAGVSGGAPASALDDKTLAVLARRLKDFRFPVSGVGGFDAAQVTAGGIATADFDPETLQSRLVPGLYACGEVLDIDGDCGGFNLQWAWASGLLAGELR
ncbi:MAG: aminoacetone oxidase family FAD-binding enzyme [Oscillospiraceae bacterium]|nr:aminoacetone oxidase family FAD-binding enzyme [Oscillospiraceae bacterium]